MSEAALNKAIAKLKSRLSKLEDRVVSHAFESRSIAREVQSLQKELGETEHYLWLEYNKKDSI